MRTKLTVNSGNNGTLKLKKGTNMLRTITAGMMLFAFSFVGMSFTSDDTARTNDSVIERKATSSDDCCTVTMVNGNQKIVITTTNSFTGKVMINDMDLNTWVNSLLAYNFQQINIVTVQKADAKMDDTFQASEKLNKKLAVAFAKNMTADVVTADAELNDLFDQTIAAPLFGKMIQNEAVATDAQMDEKVSDDAELMKMAVLFTKSINMQNADTDIDMLLNVSTIQKTFPSVITDADCDMDKLMNQKKIKTLSPVTAADADRKMDELLNNKK